MKTVDVCGISCPEPLIRLKEALKSGDDIMLITDSKNALDNCVDYAKKQGLNTAVEKNGEAFNVKISK